MASEHPCPEAGCKGFALFRGDVCADCYRKANPGVYPPGAAPPELPGITAEDFAQLIDHAKNRRMRSFSLKTTMRGVAVEFDGVFEPDPRKEPRRGE
jgi:hypothetical protein